MVSASRKTGEEFKADTILGRSVGEWRRHYPIELSIYVENKIGLPILYNAEIERALAEGDDNLILVFLHDDLTLLDFFWPDTLSQWVYTFDIVGLAGSERRTPYQPTWCHIRTPTDLVIDDFAYLCGAVGFGSSFPGKISYYGKPGRECKLMDGVFLAARVGVFRRAGLRFDPDLPFHFYDMDFCRQAEISGLRMGVAPISAMHVSGGDYESPEWLKCYNHYLKKWGE
jgi:GT2 family glycosyltransferase